MKARRGERAARAFRVCLQLTVGIVLLSGVIGCAAETTPVGTVTIAPVYGPDGRQDYFEVSESERRFRMAASNVALIAKADIDSLENGAAQPARSLSEVAGLCSGERFADQPAVAFCSGVLVDWDLVLTAGHCVRLFAPQDFSVVFDYEYNAPGLLGVTGNSVVDVVDIVAEKLDPSGTEPRLDYAWLRLAHPVVPPRQPTPVYARESPLQLDQTILSISSSGGTPLKLDAGGRVRDLRAGIADYFTADADVMHGSSGGGAFDENLSLVGVLARGGDDTVETPDGCSVIRREPAGASQEQFTYAHQAVAGLCRSEPTASSICRQDCGDPCRALPLPAFVVSGGCAISEGKRGASWGAVPMFLLAMAMTYRRRFSRQAARAFDLRHGIELAQA